MTEEIEVALLLARVFDAVGVDWFVGGSLASSLQGNPRSTNDIDVVAAMRPDQVGAFVRELGADFEADEEALQRAARTRGSWNIYHLPTAIKIDVFFAGDDPFDRSELSRRRAIPLGEGRTLTVKSAEDTILRKLLWYRAGGEISERQWRDVLGVLRLSGPVLDHAYLDGWARRLAVDDLLARARLDLG